MAHDEKENILEEHPARVLNPAERVRSHRPEYRLRPIGAAQEMIKCHYNRCRDKHAPVPIKGEKREGAKNLEMGFYPSSGEVDQQCGCKHLSHGDDMAGNRLPRTQKNQQDRESGNGTSKEDRGKEMKMDRTDGSNPSERGDPQGHA